jgi:membrane protease YdiL (CAAX protease family)
LLASPGVNDRSAIEPHRRDERTRLAAWLALISFFIVLQYVGRATGGTESDPFYKWSFAVASVVQEAVLLLIVAAIAGFSAQRLGLRLPRRLGRAAGLAVLGFFAIQAFEVVYAALAHPGNEQQLTPDRWEPSHAAQYVVNGVIVCTLVPLVEEMTFRGLGFYLLQRFGRWFAIAATGLLFGLSHGLLVSLPVLVAFGCVVAWVRSQTDSIFPGMAIHSVFNALALVVAVVPHR